VILSLALGTALRETEIANLDIMDISRGHGAVRSRITLRRFKGSQRAKPAPASAPPQRVFIPKVVRAKLVKYLGWKKRRGESIAPSDPLFLSRFGRRISARQMRHMFRVWQQRARIEEPVDFHGLRHTSLSNLYGRTKDLLLVQQQARHAHATTTLIYTHVSDEQVRLAVEELPG
jgi:integrase